MADQRRALTVTDRTTIKVRLADGSGIRRITRSLGRSVGVLSDEVNLNGGRDVYATGAVTHRAATKRALTGRKPAIAPDGPRFTEAACLVGTGWSPEQISGRRKREEDGLEQSSGLRVSHEAIYAAIHALPRGELRREPKGSGLRGKLVGMANTRDRPEEVEGRLVAGHWESDLTPGAGGASGIGTLLERTTRFVVLVQMPARQAGVAPSAFAGALNAIPEPLRKTLTYGRGKEMAGHAGLADATGMKIYFADPHSPWQRGANENTNGLLRQYFPN